MIGTANTASQRRSRTGGPFSMARSRWACALLACVLAWVGLDTRAPLLGSEEPKPAPILSAPSSPAVPFAPIRQSSVPSSPSTREVGDLDKVEPQPLCHSKNVESLAGRFELLLTETQVQRSRKLGELRAQIDALTDLLAHSAAQRQPMAAESPPPQGNSDNREEADAQRRAPPSAVPPTAATAGAKSETVTPLTNANLATGSLTDRLALANNLFGAGDIELALEFYQGLQKEDLDDAEQQWVRYQIATCHRRLGSVAAAEQIYREVASASGDDPTTAGARWWLDAIGRRNRLEEGIKGLDQAISSMEREIREPTDN